jgi:hypothetical protein
LASGHGSATATPAVPTTHAAPVPTTHAVPVPTTHAVPVAVAATPRSRKPADAIVPVMP